MRAGLVTLQELGRPGAFEDIVRKTERLCAGIGEAAQKAGIPIYQTQVGTMFCTFFTPGPVRDYASAKQSDTRVYARFFWAMLERGVYLAPSQFEAGFLSLAHTDADIEATIRAAEEAFASRP